MKKTLISLLIVALLIPMITSCAMISTPSVASAGSAEQLDASQAVADSTTSDSASTETVDGMTLTEVSISTGADECEVYAGEELAKYLQQKNVTVTDGAFPISIQIDETLGEDAFVITAVTEGEEAGMLIKGGNGRGVLYGVYKFLEELGGVRYFMPGLEKVPTTPIVITDGVVLEYTPYFESRRMN